VAEFEGPGAHAGPGRRRTVFVLASGDEQRRALAALAWREISAASLPVVVGADSPALAGKERPVGQGVLVEAVAAAQGGTDRSIRRLLSEALARWLDSGLLFALMPPPPAGADAMIGALREIGTAMPAGEAASSQAPAVLRLTNPLVLLWDVEGVLQPPYAAAPAVRSALTEGRRAVAEFFAGANPGNGLLHLHEEQLKRSVVKRAMERLADEPPRQRWVVLGLGRQFSRDIVGNVPTLAIDLERYLTWQGYEGGTHPLVGSPALELQVAVAGELGRRALLLAPFLDNAEAVVRVVDAAKNVGLEVSEVLVGVTSASVRAALELRAIAHSCATVVPSWQGVLRESAVAPYVGGWSIVGREPLETGSLLPSLPDCLPYHYPHHLGLAEVAALDFSRLALHQARKLLLAIEDTFRETEGRLLSVRDLGAVMRTPRCPPVPEGFLPPRDRFPSELVAEDIEALARLHPATHAAHRERRRDG
jgi:hypothetical protein